MTASYERPSAAYSAPSIRRRSTGRLLPKPPNQKYDHDVNHGRNPRDYRDPFGCIIRVHADTVTFSPRSKFAGRRRGGHIKGRRGARGRRSKAFTGQEGTLVDRAGGKFRAADQQKAKPET